MTYYIYSLLLFLIILIYFYLKNYGFKLLNKNKIVAYGLICINFLVSNFIKIRYLLLV